LKTQSLLSSTRYFPEAREEPNRDLQLKHQVTQEKARN
jgi:hypothetical protein